MTLQTRETFTQYRAVYQRPASFLDSKKSLERGYVEETTKPGKTKKEVLRGNYALNRSEESLAVVVRWEKRIVVAEPWEEDAE